MTAAAREPLPHFETSMPRALRQAPIGAIYEWRADDFALELGRRMRNEGAALIIDYGHDHAASATRCRRSPAIPSPIRCARRATPT